MSSKLPADQPTKPTKTSVFLAMNSFCSQNLVMHWIMSVKWGVCVGDNSLAYRFVHGCARLGNHGGSVVFFEPLGNGLEALDIVGCAFAVRARVVDVEILVKVHEQAVVTAVRVCNVGESLGASSGHKCLGTGKVGAGKQDDLRRSAGVSDTGDDFLAGTGPDVDVQVMRLVHEAKDDLVIVGVLLGQANPEIDEVLVGRTALADDATVPAAKVVDVNHAVGARVEAGLHEKVKVAKVGVVELAADLVIDNVLPRSCYMEGEVSNASC